MYTETPRVAWLLTSAFYYWQPSMACLSRLFPDTTVFTSRWHGFAPGYEDSFRYEIVGERKVISLTKSQTSYGDNFTYLPLSIVNRLLAFKPQVVFSNAFGVWTILALLFKPLGGWKVAIAYEGSSPGVDYRNSPLRLSLRRMMVWAADACISNSHAGKEYLVKCLDAKEDEVFVHPYEVPAMNSLLKQTSDAEAENDADLPAVRHPAFIFVGGVIPRKGVNLLLQACALLQQRGQAGYTLLVVGDGTQRAELEQFCQENNLTDCVQWVGQIDYDRLGAYFQLADVFVFPTLEDTWGMVILESMVLGKPLLCSRLAGASELVLEGENGYTFDPREPERLADLMEKFIQNPEIAAAMGKRSQEVMAQYTPEAAAAFLGKVTSFMMERGK